MTILIKFHYNVLSGCCVRFAMISMIMNTEYNTPPNEYFDSVRLNVYDGGTFVLVASILFLLREQLCLFRV